MSLPKIAFPTFDVVLPSTKEKIKCRTMLAKEQKILLIAKESAENNDIVSAIRQVVNNCVVTPKFDIDKCTIFDIELMFIRINAASVTNIAKTAYIDNEDQQTYNFDIDLNTVDVLFPENVDQKIVVNDQVTITMKYPTASLYNDKKFLESTGEQMIEYLIDRCIDKVNDQPFYAAAEGERKTFLESLPVVSYDKIRAFLTSLPHLNHEIKYTNKNGNERKIVLTTLADFFTLA